MNHSEIAEKYLVRVILFKEKQALYTDFCDESKRESLLKRLFDDLGFEPHLWIYRKECAERYFKIYDALEDDYTIGRTAPKLYAALLEKYIRKAIALDPYNEKYLREYFRGPVGQNKPDKKLALQLICLFHPNSADFQNLLVDLKLKSNEVIFDYLSESVTTPFISEMVLLQEKLPEVSLPEKTEQQLQHLAKEAGLDSQALKSIGEDVKQMLRTVQDALNSYSADWQSSYKATLAMEKILDLAPYDKDVLLTGMTFYGGFYWRALLGYKEIKGDAGKTELMEHALGVKKPKREHLFRKSVEIFRRSFELKERLLAVLQKEEREQNQKSTQKEFGMPYINRADFNLRYNRILRSDKTNRENIDAYMDKEIITFKLLTGHFKSKKHDLRIILISGSVTFIFCALFSRWVFGSFVPFFPFFIPVFVVPGVILYVREKIFQRKKTDIDETPDLGPMVY